MIARMQELSAQYPRFGYRRVRIFLGRDGFAMSPGRAHRLWRVANSRCRASAHESVCELATTTTDAGRADQVWAFDFVFDACADGRQLKCLTVRTNSRGAWRSKSTVVSDRARDRVFPCERARRSRISPTTARSSCRARCSMSPISIDTALSTTALNAYEASTQFRDDVIVFRSKPTRSSSTAHTSTPCPHSASTIRHPDSPPAQTDFSVHSNGPGRCRIWAFAPRPVAQPPRRHQDHHRIPSQAKTVRNSSRSAAILGFPGRALFWPAPHIALPSRDTPVPLLSLLIPRVSESKIYPWTRGV